MPDEQSELLEALGMVWDVDEYEKWAVVYYSRPIAPYCDFKRYTKCADPGACADVVCDKKACKTPKYKKKVTKHVVHQVVQCKGSEQDFDALCCAFKELTIPWAWPSCAEVCTN